MQCDVYELTCSNGHILRYGGQEDHIFFKSANLGIGEEMFWDFHAWFNYGKLSFKKYCFQMTEVYRSTNPNSAPFVSIHTFKDLFFSWIVRMDIDFRQEIDPWCGHDPEVLACDGTHIGVSLKLLDLQEPITKPELEDQPEALHQINQRCFLPYPPYDKSQFKTKKVYKDHCKAIKTARNYLFLLCCRVLKDDYDLVEDEHEERVNESALVAALKNCSVVLSTFVTMFMRKELHPDVMIPAAKLLKMMLKHDAALSQFFPYRFHNHLMDCLEAVQTSSPGFEHLLPGIKAYGVEIFELLSACTTSDNTDFVVNFLREMVKSVIKLHANDRPAAPPIPIPGTYNPPSGTAYYFTEHGQKVREMPNYLVNDSQQDKENKQARRVPACTKLYPGVSSGGWGYIFLFFCPKHGHCYGFHMVDGAEGRKDPFSALYKYKPTPPKELFYDFACQFNEYSLNREPDYFKWVRAWHDLFHGCNHTCVPCFKSTRVQGLSHINSEICEQFNSYLQSIKFTGSHLSQTHFMLFTQFMIFLWNREKTKRFKRIEAVAKAGLE